VIVSSIRTGAGGGAAPRKRRSYACADDRRAEILRAARELFLEHGYVATSTDAIVKAGGGSKHTFYELFGSKAGLFRDVAASAAASIVSAIEAPLDPAEPARALRAVGVTCLSAWVAPKSLGIMRLVIAESPRIPEIGDILVRYGTKAPEEALVDYLRRCNDAGTLDAGNAELLARAFIALVVRPVLPSLMKLTPFSAAQIEKHVDEVVPLFLRLCERRPATLAAGL
jgi:AcrR family transcriptional regulator